MSERNELTREVAKAIARMENNGGDPDQPAVRWNGIEMEPQDFPLWQDYRDVATAAITAYDECIWQTIDSAPKDGTRILLYAPAHLIMLGGWGGHGRYSGPDWYSNGVPLTTPPTHWQPLPEMPKAKP